MDCSTCSIGLVAVGYTLTETKSKIFVLLYFLKISKKKKNLLLQNCTKTSLKAANAVRAILQFDLNECQQLFCLLCLEDLKDVVFIQSRHNEMFLIKVTYRSAFSMLSDPTHRSDISLPSDLSVQNSVFRQLQCLHASSLTIPLQRNIRYQIIYPFLALKQVSASVI